MVRPKHSLEPGSQQWARSIESDIEQLKLTVGKNGSDVSNTLNSINSSLRLLSDLVNLQVFVEGDSARVFNFTLNASPSPSPAASVVLTKPSWATKAVVTVIGTGYLVSNTTAALPRMNVSIAGEDGMAIDMARVDAASAVPYSSTNAYTTVLDPCPDTITCATTFWVVVPADYYTGEANRMCNTSATVIYTR